MRSGATMVDGDSFTAFDGENVGKKFEFDTDDSVTPLAVPIPFEITDTLEEMKQAAADAINALGDEFQIGANVRPGNEVRLQNENDGPAGNIPIIENVADPLFVVSGMDGGSDGPELAGLVSAPAGDHVFVLGYQLPGQVHRFDVGDFAQVEQNEDFGSTTVIRFVAIVRPPDINPSGIVWRFSLLIDGAEYVGRNLDAARGRTFVDMAANVSKLVGNHDLAFRVELVNA
jgi:hypothetical protein